MRLYGRETIGSHFTQALVARRQQAFRYAAETVVDFTPRHFQQAAGLVCYYNSTKFHYLHITAGDDGSRQIQILSAIPRETGSSLLSQPVRIEPGPIAMKVEVDYDTLRFAYRAAEAPEWIWLPDILDASILSDEATLPGMPNFTGTFVGMACQDLSGAGRPADFGYFRYTEHDEA